MTLQIRAPLVAQPVRANTAMGCTGVAGCRPIAV
jgi:hypothetical protein